MRSFLPAVGWRSLRSGDVDTLGGRITGLPAPAADSDAATKEYVDDSGGGSSPHVGEVFSVTVADDRAIPDSSWDQFPFANAGTVPQDWASVDGADIVIDASAGLLVNVQAWMELPVDMTGDARGILIACQGGGGVAHLDDAATILSPAEYAALADFESSIGSQGMFRVDPDTGLTLQLFMYQDSGAPMSGSLVYFFVTVVG